MPSPLTEEHLKTIDEALEQSKDIKETILRAKQAGMDMQPFEEALDDSEKRLRATKQAFFPGR